MAKVFGCPVEEAARVLNLGIAARIAEQNTARIAKQEEPPRKYPARLAVRSQPEERRPDGVSIQARTRGRHTRRPGDLGGSAARLEGRRLDLLRTEDAPRRRGERRGRRSAADAGRSGHGRMSVW